MLATMPATLKPCDGERLNVEMRIGNRRTKLAGLARYASGKLIVAIGDPNGNFNLVLDEATWDGEVFQDSAGSYGLRIE